MDAAVMADIAAHPDSTAAEIRWRLKITHEAVYESLVRLEGSGKARLLVDNANPARWA